MLDGALASGLAGSTKLPIRGGSRADAAGSGADGAEPWADAREGSAEGAGDAADAAAAMLNDRRNEVRVAPHSAPEARGVAAAATRILLGGAPIEPLRPLYLRAPDVSFPKAR